MKSIAPILSLVLAGVCLSVIGAAAAAQEAGSAAVSGLSTQSQPAKEAQSDPYPLETCPVSGEKLGGMGDPVVKEYDGREVRFCCKNCVKKFEADKAGYWKKIDEKIVEQQKDYYPLTTCPISGEELGGMGEPVDYVYNNRLIRFCCKNCVGKFEKDPQPTLKKLDAAVIDRQAEHYPLTTCIISGEALGGMGKPVDMVFNNHLVRLCCSNCIKKFRSDPAAHLAALDAAWKQRGGVPKP